MPKIFIITLFMCLSAAAGAQTLPLSGAWQFATDSLDQGITEGWQNKTFKQSLRLPGTLDDAGVGNKPTLSADSLTRNVMLMLTRKHRYVGPAWYAREITVPQNWKGRHVSLLLERVLWTTHVWIDGKEIGTRNLLSAPHRYDLGQLLTPGKHRIVIRVDNRRQYDMSSNNMAHAYTDGTQILWNGILGKMELQSRPAAHIADVQTWPDLSKRILRITINVNNEGPVSSGTLSLQTGKLKKSLPVELKEGENRLETEIAVPEGFAEWSEFTPVLHTLTADLKTAAATDRKQLRFGWRNITNHDAHLQINGKRMFLRGTLECAIFPLTGHPPMDRKGWEKVFSSAKAYGLNHLRFHSWCPPEAAFAVADSMGFYLQVELPFWNNTAGKYPEMNTWLELEAEHISREYGHHPSFCFWSMGNELEGDFNWLESIVAKLKKADPRHLYATTAFTFQKDHGAWPEPGDEFFITQWTKKGWVRGQGIFNSIAPSFNNDYTKETEGLPVPIITHEIGQYSVFPNMEEIKKYTGVLDPLNFKAVRNDLQRKNLLHLAPAFLQSSGKFAALLYKEEIERAMKTKYFSGFQLLDLHDFPGQGTALIGILDAFWDSKGLVTPEQHRMYCQPAVPLLRFAKATYRNSETFTAAAETANFSGGTLKGITPAWTVKTAAGKQLFSGKLALQDIAEGTGQQLGEFRFPLAGISRATALTITLHIGDRRNEWHIWVYPEKQNSDYANVHYTRSASEAMGLLQQGKKVLLNPDTAHIRGVDGRFAPVFWSPVHFPNQPGTMGVLVNPKHPALADFPTEAWSDWQWWHLITSSKTMILDELPAIDPVVRVIDNFFKNRKMANVIEANVGKGKLILVSADLSTDPENRPAAEQLKRSLMGYMNGASFQPKVTLTEAQVQTLLQ